MKNVIDFLAKSVSLYPDKKAVKDSIETLTFRELWNNATRISLNISDLIGGGGNPVSVFLPKSCKMVTAFAGINMSGNFYVPLDTKSPLERIKNILDVTETKIVITDKNNAETIQKVFKHNVILIEDSISSTSNVDFDWDIQRQKFISNDPVYSIFTSGSTGIPKGVLISHKGVIDYIDWAVNRFHFTSDAVIGNQAPFYFDNSTLDIYLMYATGATLSIIPETCFAFPAKLVDYLNEERISFVFWVPFVLVNVANLNIFESKKPEYLKDVFFAGEVMPNKHLNYWRKHLPQCRYANLYGPTEITVDCTCYEVNREFRDDEPLPIGVPCRNSDVLILVDRKRLAEVGEQGELCVRG